MIRNTDYGTTVVVNAAFEQQHVDILL